MNRKVLRLAIIGLMAALSYIAFTFLQIKVPTPGGFTSFHLGNTFCVIAALLLGGIPGGIAGAIGMGIGDLMDPAYVIVAPKTIVLKLLIGIVTGLVAHRFFHIQDLKGKKLYKAVFISALAGMLTNIFLEPFISYFYTAYLLGAPQDASRALASWNAMTTSVNGILTVIVSSLLYITIQPRLKNQGILKKLAPQRRKKYE